MQEAPCFTDVLELFEKARTFFQYSGGLISDEVRATFKAKADALKKALRKECDSGVNVDLLEPPETKLGQAATEIFGGMTSIFEEAKEKLDGAAV